MADDSRDVEREPALFHAIVHAPVAPMHAEPRIASQMISQQLAGHRVDVLDEQGDWVRACGPDEYDGWMHHGFLTRTDSSAADAQETGSQPPRISLGCVSTNGAGGVRALPLRALLAASDVVQSGEVIDVAQLARRFPRAAGAITRSARQFFRGTSYLWGGVTPWGADCSGLVQSVFALHGIQLPRDAWQQSEAGEDAGRDIDSLREGDLLFFSDRGDQLVTHVAIALGDGRIVHQALGRGGYAVDRLDDAGDAYVRKLRERFLFARRVL